MTIALDLGTSALRSLRMDDDRLAGRSARSVYSVVDDSLVRRQMLDQLGLTYAICDGSLAIPGDAARDFADLMHAPVLPLMPGGALLERDPPARQMVAALIEGMTDIPTSDGAVCGVVLPGVAGSHEGRNTETARFLTHVIRLRGYEPVPITPGAALVLADLVGDGFTGVGMMFGAAACHVSLMHRSVEITSCVIDRGGAWIDEQLAQCTEQFLWDAQGNRYLNAEGMCRWKESSQASLADPGPGDRDQALIALYSELMGDVVKAAGDAFNAALDHPDSWPAMSVVACGGPTRIAGFVPMLARIVREGDWPVRIKQVRIAEDSEFTVARGCLIKAELDAEMRQTARAA